MLHKILKLHCQKPNSTSPCRLSHTLIQPDCMPPTFARDVLKMNLQFSCNYVLQMRLPCTIFAGKSAIPQVKLVLISILLVGICVMLLGVRVFFVKGGKFPNTHIHGNAALKKKGITCASEE